MPHGLAQSMAAALVSESGYKFLSDEMEAKTDITAAEVDGGMSLVLFDRSGADSETKIRRLTLTEAELLFMTSSAASLDQYLMIAGETILIDGLPINMV
jgi:hypothetical protein